MNKFLAHIIDRTILTTICFCFSIINILAQTPLTTLSGQKILYTLDGKWSYAGEYLAEDSRGLLLTDMNPMVVPIQKKFAISENHKKGISLLSNEALKQEIAACIAGDIAKNQLMLNQATFEKSKTDTIIDTSFVRKIKSIIDHNKFQIKESTQKQKVLLGIIQEISSLNDISEDKRNKGMKVLADQLNIDISQYIKIIDVKPFKKDEVKVDKSIIDFKPIMTCSKDSSFTNGISTQFVSWYKFSPQKMKRFLKTKDLMNTFCAIANDGDNYLMRTKFVISSKDATKTYGGIAKGNFIKITFTTGKTVHLTAIQESAYQLEKYTGNVVFDATFLIKKDDVSIFRKNTIDTIGVMWSSGFEVYPIYEVDAVLNAFDCFNSLDK